MSNRLLVNPGTPQAWKIELRPGLNRIGRGDSNDFVINHPSIATHHCELIVTESTVLLTSLDATHGTFVERVPVTEFQLHPGHHVQLGSVDMVFQTSGLPDLPDAVNLPGDGARIVVANPGPTTPPPPVPVSPHPNHQPGAISNTTAASEHSTATHTEIAATPGRPALQRGAAGAIAGGLIGMFAWYFLVRVAESDSDWFAWGVGAMTAFGGRFFAREGSHALGMVCGSLALMASLGGIYLGAHHSEAFKSNLSLFTFLWLFLGVITAYKIAANQKD